MLKNKTPGDLLKDRVAFCSSGELLSNSVFISAKKGILNKNHIAIYNFNLQYIMAQTPLHLKRASEKSLQQGEVACSESFKKRIPEEVGHDLWAFQDLAQLNLSKAELSRLHLLPAIEGLNSYITQIIELDTLHYAIYALWAEYFTVLVVPSFVYDLEHFCGISSSFMSALVRHAEIDKDHVADDVSIVNELLLIRGSYDLEKFYNIIDTATNYYRQFTNQIMEMCLELPPTTTAAGRLSDSSVLA